MIATLLPLAAETRQQQPELWNAFVSLIHTDGRAEAYQDMIEAIDVLPVPDEPTLGALSIGL